VVSKNFQGKKSAFAPSIGRTSAAKSLQKVPTHTLHYGYIYNDGKLIDEVMVGIMRAPHSYTGEDVVEISGHGSWVVLKQILETVLKSGARLAYPGEFTKRAFLSGRIDLAQAEAVNDIINAESETGLTYALRQLKGDLSEKIGEVREGILNLLTQLEAALNFPEEEIPLIENNNLLDRLKEIQSKLASLLRTFPEGKLAVEGITVSIVGKPNVGKSSLFNALIGKDKAIVTAYPGTTRDGVEAKAEISGFPVKFVDTAGYLPLGGVSKGTAAEEIEKVSVQKTLETLKSAEVVLAVVDVSLPLTENDEEIIKQIKVREGILVANKVDLPRRVTSDSLESLWPQKKIVYTSATELQGIDDLREAIVCIFLNPSQ